MVSISGCAPRDGNGFLAQTRCQQLGNTKLASGSELMMVVNHIRARLGLPDFVGSWEFARDAYYLGMCLDLLTSDAIAFIERYERALIDSITAPQATTARKSLVIDPAIAPSATPRKAVEELMADDRPPSVEIVVSMLTGMALLGVLFALPYTLPRVEQVNERRQVLARMKDRAFTPRDHGERGEHTFMNLGRPVGCLWEHATRAALIVAFAVGFIVEYLTRHYTYDTTGALPRWVTAILHGFALYAKASIYVLVIGTLHMLIMKRWGMFERLEPRSAKSL